MAAESVKSEKKTKKKKAKGSNKAWETFKLKASLLRIWFFKNLKTFLLVALLIYLILILTGNATGGFLFGGLSEEIAKVTSATTVGDVLMNILAVILSIGTTVGFFYKKVHGIRLQDIKSKKLKLALISAGLYFNKDGKLVKRVEQIMQVDVDNDGKINKTPVAEVNQVAKDFNIIKGTVDAFGELKTILTSKIETQEDYRDLIQEAELQPTKDAFDDLDGKVTLPSISVTLDNVTIGTDPTVITDDTKVDITDVQAEIPNLITNEDIMVSSDENVEVVESLGTDENIAFVVETPIPERDTENIVANIEADNTDIPVDDNVLDSMLTPEGTNVVEDQNHVEDKISNSEVKEDNTEKKKNSALTTFVEENKALVASPDAWKNVSDYHKKKIFSFAIFAKVWRYIADGVKHLWKKIFKERSKTVEEIVTDLPSESDTKLNTDVPVTKNEKLDIQIIVNEDAVKIQADEAAELKRKQHEESIAAKLVAESKPVIATPSEAETAAKNAAATERAQKALERLLK